CGFVDMCPTEPPFSPTLAMRNKESLVADCRQLSSEDPFSTDSGSLPVARRD
ncbi:hypothetical protein A2U01_0083812, partial [Trifolium medium]|nr:hypothetical protein [Trifolium medium]